MLQRHAWPIADLVPQSRRDEREQRILSSTDPASGMTQACLAQSLGEGRISNRDRFSHRHARANGAPGSVGVPGPCYRFCAMVPHRISRNVMPRKRAG